MIADGKAMNLFLQPAAKCKNVNIRSQLFIGDIGVTDVIAFVLCLFVFAFMIRWKLMPIESADYFGFLEPWMEEIRENGGFDVIRRITRKN